MKRLLQIVLLLLGLARVASANGTTGDNVVRLPDLDRGGTTLVGFRVNLAEPQPTALEDLAKDKSNFELLEYPIKDGKPDEEQKTPIPIAATDGLKDPDQDYKVVAYSVFFEAARFHPGRHYRLVPKRSELGGRRDLWVSVGVKPGSLPSDGFRLVDRTGRNRRLTHELRLDLRPVENGDNELAIAIDYYLKIAMPLHQKSTRLTATEAAGDLSRYRLDEGYFGFTSKGYIIQPDNMSGKDSIVSELQYQRAWIWLEQFSGKAADGSESQVQRDPFALLLDVHFKHEADQDFDDHNIVFGVGTSFTLPWRSPLGGDEYSRRVPWPVLWLAPILLPNRKALAAIQQPWFNLGFDGVLKADDSTRSLLTSNDSYVRLVFEMGWTSEVVRANTWLYFDVMLWYELDAPGAVEAADLDLHHFFEVGLKLPIHPDAEKIWVVVKYITGELPPNFADESQFSVGFGFDF